MRHFVYILKSSLNGKYYIGRTTNLDRRLMLNNAGTIFSTKRYKPWILFHSEIYLDETSAANREKQIKNWKSRKAIERLKFGNKIEDPRFRNRVRRGRNRDNPQANV